MVHVDGFCSHQRGSCIEKMEIVSAEIFTDGLGQIVRSQRTRGNDHRAFRHLRYFLGRDCNIGMIFDLLGHEGRESKPVNCQAAAGLHSGGFSALHDQAATTTQLFLQQTNCILQPVTPKRIGTDQFTKVSAMMGR